MRSSKRMLVATVLLLSMFTAGMSATASQTGTIAFGHPATWLTPGITESNFITSGCTINPTFNGKDAYVIDLGAPVLNKTKKFEMTSTSVGNLHSLNIAWYAPPTPPCSPFFIYQGVTTTQQSWTKSAVPLNGSNVSRWVVISGTRSVNITLTYTIFDEF